MKLDRVSSLGQLKDGKLALKNTPWFRNNLAKYEDCKVRVIVERVKNSRSTQQNNWYFGCVLPLIAESTGHSVEDLHEIFKSRYLKQKRVWRGADITTLKSTTELTTGEFVEYTMNIIAEAGELGIEIPDPDQLYDT